MLGTNTSTMRAAVIDRPDHVEIKNVALPLLQENHALIKVTYCGICGTDIHVIKGEYAPAVFPLIPGHEYIGELVDFKGTTNLQKGDLVAAQPILSCGNCDPCAKGRDNVCQQLKILGCHTDGSFAQYITVPLQKVYSIPKNVSPKLAALTEPLAVAVHDVHRSGLQVGDTSLVIGGGPIGLLIALVARESGASKVVISEINEYRRGFAEDLGFDTINPLDEDFEASLNNLTENKGFDVIFEVSGAQSAFTTALDHCKITGTVVLIGLSNNNINASITKIVQKELDIKGVRVQSQISFIDAITLLKNGAINDDLSKLISKVFTFDEVAEAFEFAQSDKSFKVLVKID